MDSKPTVDYRHPTTPGSLADPVRSAIVGHVTSMSGAWLAMSVLGLIVLLASAAVFALGIVLISFEVTEKVVPWIPILFAVLALQGLWVVREWKLARSEYEIAESALDGITDAGKPSSRGEWEMHAEMVQTAMWADVLTWGPRQVAMGLRRVTGRAVVPGGGRIDRAVEVTRVLMQSGNAMRLSELQSRTGGHPGTLAVIEWMKRSDLIDGSADGKRIWLSSDLLKDIERRSNPER
jgi:hypothetical protein